MGYLRVYLALCVVFSHMGYNMFLPADLAVEIFFIISGFYMSFVLNERYKKSSQNMLFYKKRFLRLLPIYWICGLIGLGLAYIMYLKGVSSEFLFDFSLFKESHFSSYIYLIICNVFALGEDIALFLHWNIDTSQMEFTVSSYSENYPMIRFFASPVAWSLGLEFFFYLIAPFFLRKNLKVVGLIFAISFIVKMIIRYGFGLNDGNWTFRFFLSELCCFCFGYFCYRVYKFIDYRNYTIPYSAKYALLLVMVVLSLYHSSYIITFFLFLAYVIIAVPVLFYLSKHDSFDRNIGDLSYIIYLVHPIVICSCQFISPSRQLIMVMMITLLTSFLLYRYVESPIERYRKRLK